MPPRSVTRSPAASSFSSALVGDLARHAGKQRQLLLRDLDVVAGSRIQHRVEQPGQMARDPRGRVVDAIGLDGGDELAHALVELVHQEAGEADAAARTAT